MREIIYGLVDTSTMKLRYVGQTVHPLHKRLKKHLTRSDNPYLIQWLHDADVSAVVLERDPEDLNEAERQWIKSSLTQGAWLLNQKVGGYRGPVTDETRAKISAASRGRMFSEETRTKMSSAHQGMRPSPEACAKISNALRGHLTSQETRAKLSTTRRGHRASPEARAKMSAVHRGHPISQETRAKISAARRAQMSFKKSQA